LSGLARGILCTVPHVFIRSLVSGYIRLKLALMVLLSDIWLVLLLVVFSMSMVEIMMRLFTPVAHMTTIHTLFAMASIRIWSISQLDVKNVFLNSELCENVYMRPPPEYSVPESMVCQLRRSLYGLKQVPRAWFQCFTSVITAAGFSASAHDPALFIHMSTRGMTFLLFFVDDIIITGDDPEYIAFIKAHLSDQFLMSDFGHLRYFLGIEISSTPGGSFCLKRSIFRIFFIVLLLLITGLLRLSWSSMFTLWSLIVNLLRIILAIVIL
jgi:hypothetical protein